MVKNPGNPWRITSSNYATYEPYQRPWKDGIIAGNMPPTTSYALTSTITFTPQLTTDTDSDGFTDIAELSAGTNPNDPNSFPISLFSVFNNI